MRFDEPLKKLPKAGNVFEGASGHKYYIRTVDEGITFERWKAFEKLSLLMPISMTFDQLWSHILKAEDITNNLISGKSKVIDLILHNHAIKKGVARVMNGENHAAWYLCTLFIVREDEDLRTWNTVIADEKIEDWNNSGYDMNDFFFFAASGVKGFREAYEQATQLQEV